MAHQSGYSLPLSPGGTASLVPAPPWHYVGDFLVIEYWADPAAVAAVLPEGLEPHADPGRCAALFVDWQSCSDSGAELKGVPWSVAIVTVVPVGGSMDTT